ncbi:hypothetical protein JW998_05430 [candidate division KSB1 bacterium]|nr:hypothetical protein [candidate division KSB1 bacterium]
MEGICGFISFDRALVDIPISIQEMAHSLSDGETLDYEFTMNSNWAMARSYCPGKTTCRKTFLYHDAELSLVAVADIYNAAELAPEYDGEKSEIGKVLAACYKKNGREWAVKIRGNFAIILFDVKKNQMIAITDRFGVRPLVWHKRGNTFYFASRMNAIAELVRPLDVNNAAVYAYIQLEMIPAPMTIYKNVHKLEPGYQMCARQDSYDIDHYWDISNQPKLQNKDEIAEHVYETLSKAVDLTRNGVKNQAELGCFLSGGTDSSTICGLLSRLNGDKVKAYSIGFPENGYDEMMYARIAAKAFHLDHNEYYVKPADVMHAFPKLLHAYDEPYGNSSIIPAYFCALNARESGVTCMLAGDGGDEIFGGNQRYSEQQVFRNYFKLPGLVRRSLLEPLLLNRLERLPLTLFQKAGSYIRRAKMGEVERIDSYRYVQDEELFDPAFLDSNMMKETANIAESHFARLKDAELLDRHLYLDMKMTITDNDLVKVTRMTELAGVHVRYPMLDHPLVDLAFRIPTSLKLKGTYGLRYIFKYAFRDLLPVEIIQKKKHGFGLPISEWLRKQPDVQDFARDLLFSRDHLQRGYVKPDFVEKLWRLHLQDNTPYYGTILWKLIMLEAWHQSHC